MESKANHDLHLRKRSLREELQAIYIQIINKMNTLPEIKVNSTMDKILDYKTLWINHVDRM